MKRKLSMPLVGAFSLVLTIGWSGSALTGPEPPTGAAGRTVDSRETGHASVGQAFEMGHRPAPGSGPGQVGNQPRSLARPSLMVIDRELLAKVSFPEGGATGEGRAGFLAPPWPGIRLPRVDGEERSAGEAGGRAFTEPLSLFLLGTGMFGLAAFKRRWNR